MNRQASYMCPEQADLETVGDLYQGLGSRLALAIYILVRRVKLKFII